MNDAKEEMRHRSTTEYVLLGALLSGEMHGYELMQFLSSALEMTWRVSTSQLYVLLKRLEKQECLGSRAEEQGVRPSRRVFHITPKGKKEFLAWLQQPVHHVRELRVEFLCKLFFFDHLALAGAKDLVEGQIRVLEHLLARIRRDPKKDESEFMKVVYSFKTQSVECMLSWLTEEVMPFVS